MLYFWGAGRGVSAHGFFAGPALTRAAIGEIGAPIGAAQAARPASAALSAALRFGGWAQQGV